MRQKEIKRGDKEAFARFYDYTASVMMGAITGIVFDEEQAEHVLRLCFIKLWAIVSAEDIEVAKLRMQAIRMSRREAVKYIRENIDQKSGDMLKDWTAHTGISPDGPLGLIFLKGFTLAEAAQTLHKTESEIKLAIRRELKKFVH